MSTNKNTTTTNEQHDTADASSAALAAAIATFATAFVQKTTSPDDYKTALGKAIAYWRSGRDIPLTLATSLLADGYDISALEAYHRG